MILLFFCACIFINDASSLGLGAPRDKPRVAVLIVGRSLCTSAKCRMAADDAANMVESMTGEEKGDADADSKIIEERLSGPKVIDDASWRSAVSMLIEPVNRTHLVDVYVCVDRARGRVPAEVSEVFEETASGQEARGAKCLSRLKSSGRHHDWLVKIRPDFVFYRPFPPMASFRPGYVYTRFRTVQGIGGLTSDHLSYDWCQPRCNGIPDKAIGYTNDDMIRVVPGALIDFAFRDSAVTASAPAPPGQRQRRWGGRRRRSLANDFTFPVNWVNIANCSEGRLTRFWAERNVLTMPLACPGYPRDSVAGAIYRDMSMPCAAKPVEKTICSPAVTIESAHETLMKR